MQLSRIVASIVAILVVFHASGLSRIPSKVEPQGRCAGGGVILANDQPKQVQNLGHYLKRANARYLYKGKQFRILVLHYLKKGKDRYMYKGKQSRA
jgi:hypothetical protein